MDLAVLEKHALQLAPADRAVLAEHLLQSLEDPSILSAWVAESGDRLAAYDKGEIQSRDAADAIADLRASLAR